MAKPAVNLCPPASEYAGPHERIIEVWADDVKQGLLISMRVIRGNLVVEPYRADPGVILRWGGDDLVIPK